VTNVPKRPCIYHITHVDNLPSILTDGGLWSDAEMLAHGRATASIGMSGIKQRRLHLPVGIYPGDRVGDYVPFYFCPRSIMLYLLHRANHPELTYRSGQEPIVHLEAELPEVVHWARSEGCLWTFSLSNAGAAYAEFRNRLSQLDEVDWRAVAAKDFRDPSVKEGKQAEFLVHGFFPWHLIRRIGVCTRRTQNQVLRALSGAQHRPVVELRKDWYY